MKLGGWILTVGIFCGSLAYGQQPTPTFTPSTQPQRINWQQFQPFSLPFKIIYGGPRFGEPSATILQRGFTHINTLSDGDSQLPPQNRALLYYGVAYATPPQPWQQFRSPWSNDMSVYRNKWQDDFTRFAQQFDDTNIDGKLKADLLVFDIERQIKSNDSIALLKSNPTTPAALAALPNNLFVETYKKDLQERYAEPLNALINSPLNGVANLATYADTPILNTFTTLQANSWQKWQTDVSVVNPNVLDFKTNRVGGALYNQVNILMPSAYYYFDYPSPFGADYLSYLLFQIEANRARSDKPIIPFVWLKYSQNTSLRNVFIRRWMAEATAIFPFFSGASGLWLWEDPTTFKDNLVYASYEHFINGLQRLSTYKNFFQGNYTLHAAISARDYNEKRMPIWRAVSKGDSVLIAAHNPYAKSETEQVNVAVSVGNWSTVIQLTGYEVALKAFNRAVLSLPAETAANALQVIGNPSSSPLQLSYYSAASETVKFQLIGLDGTVKWQESIAVSKGQNRFSKNISSLHSGTYIVKIIGASSESQIKIIIQH